MFERFTDEARRVVVLASEEARGLGHNWIGTEHVLLGIMAGGDSVGFRLLQLFEVPFPEVEARILEMVGEGQGETPGHLPFTPRAKKVLEMSLREALQLGESYIGTEHLLLGLLREGQGVGAQVLVERGVTLQAVRERLSAVERDEAPTDGPSPEMIEVPAEQFSRLLEEITRLRDLLRLHGIDPGDELPGFGKE